MNEEIQETAQEFASTGARLRDAREGRGLTLRDLAAVTKIQASLLQYLEEDRYDEFPAEVFARGFLKNYARELGLDVDDVLDQYRRETGARRPATVVVMTEDVPARQERAVSRFAEVSTLGRVAYGAGLALLVLGLALSVLVFGDSDDSAAANYQPADYGDAWQAVPAGENDWQSYREN